MKILFITEFLPQSERAEITGGVEARCHYVINHLRQRHDVAVIARRTDGTLWEHTTLASLPGRLWFLVRALVRALRTDFDVVEGSNYVVYPVVWLAGRLKRRPIVFFYVDVLLGTWRSGQFGAAGALGEILERIALRLRIDRYITCTETVVAKLAAHGVDPGRITVVPCGYEPDHVDRVRRREPVSGDTVSVVSRLVPYKRVDLILHAVARLAPSHPALRLVVVGRGPEMESLQRQAARLGIADRVEFRGFVEAHDDVLRAVADSRVFVSASEVEGFGIVLVEAMALGVPYVATDIPVFVEVTGGGTGGLHFRAGDADDLAGRLKAVLDDPELHQRLRAAGTERARAFTWSEVARRSEEVYAEVVAGRAGRQACSKGRLLTRYRALRR